MPKNKPKVEEVSRVSTGADGLDDILRGGLPAGRMYVIEGEPGTGKTTLAMGFLLRGLRNGLAPLYISLSETENELRSSAASHGWDFSKISVLEIVPDEADVENQQEYTVFYPTEVELSTTVTRMLGEVDRLNPALVVIDSVSEIRLLAQDPVRYRRQMLAIKRFFSRRKATVLILDDRRVGAVDNLQLHTIAHGVIRLSKLPRDYGVIRRHLEVLKVRGSSFREGFHDYVIEMGGVRVFPRLVAGEHAGPMQTESAESGIAGLDAMVGGGLPRGTSTLVTGPSGIGKSSLTMQYVTRQALAGHQAIYYTFDEVTSLIARRCQGLGIPMAEAMAQGKLRIEQVDPAELSPGQFVDRVRAEIDSGVSVVAIDSLAGLMSSMPGEKELAMQLHELLCYLNQKGVLTFTLLTASGLVGDLQPQIDVSYLTDNIILMRYFEVEGELRRAVSMMKKRAGKHEDTIRQLDMSGDAIVVGPPIRGLHGVLSGIPIMGNPASGSTKAH